MGSRLLESSSLASSSASFLPFSSSFPHQRAKEMTAVLVRDVVSLCKQGLQIAWEGFYVSIQCSTVRKVYRQFLIYGAVSCCMIYLVGMMLFVPVYIVLYVVDVLFRCGMLEKLPSVWVMLGEAALALPMLGGLFVRYIYPKPFHDIFFAALSPSTKEMLAKIAYPELQFRMRIAMKKILRAIMIGLVLLLLSYIPRIGFLVFPLAQFLSTYQQLGLKLAGIVVCFSLVPGFRSLWLVAVAFGWSARAICIELMDPYLGRLRTVERAAVKEFLSGNVQLVLVSFAIPFTILLAIPFVGPVVLPIFQSSAALFVERLANKDTLNRLSIIAATKYKPSKTDSHKQEQITA